MSTIGTETKCFHMDNDKRIEDILIRLWRAYQTAKGSKFKGYLVGTSLFAFLGAVALLQRTFETSWTTAILVGIGFVLLVNISFTIYFFVKQAPSPAELLPPPPPAPDYIDYFKLVHSLNAEADRIISIGVTNKKVSDFNKLVCNGLKEVFDKTKKTNSYNTSIKVTASARLQHKTILKNMCRDNGPNSKKRQTPAYTQKSHTVAGNACFSHIVNKLKLGEVNELYYNHPDILSDPKYTTSSKGTYNADAGYLSELVVPIIPIPSQLKSKIPPTKGFLCVDCAQKQGFDNEHDLLLLQCVAGSLYNVMNNKKASSSKSNP